MKNNLLIIFLTVSGIFQLISISFDQYVIQQEKYIRNYDNNITLLFDQKTQVLNGNLSFGRFYLSKVMQARNILEINDFNNDNFSKNILKDLNKDLYDQQNLILNNSYLPKITDYFTEEQKKDLDKTIENSKGRMILGLLDNQGTIIGDKFDNYAAILANLFNSYNKITEKISKANKSRQVIVLRKFNFLVYGMISNILSILFLLLFFYQLVNKIKSTSTKSYEWL